MIIAYCCCRNSAEEYQRSSIREVWNSFLARVSRAFQFLFSYFRKFYRRLTQRRPVDKCTYLEFDPNIKSHKIIFKQIVRRGTKTPYEFKFYDPAHIISGIACGPQDDETSSPEVEVVDGGISCHHVMIRLSPIQKGPWACCIEISGPEENSVHLT